MESKRQVVSYSRCSTLTQASSGVSLEYQQERLKDYAERNRLEIVQEFVDAGLSGKNAKRPELQSCLDLACKSKVAILTYSISRISRSVKDMAFINDRMTRAGVQLISLSEQIDTSTASGKLTFQLFISLAEHERNQLAERVSTAMSHLRHQGRRISGRIPYGFRVEGEYLIPEKAEQAAIAIMRELRAKGRTFRQVGEELMAQGIKPKNGGKAWCPGAILRILNSQQQERAVAA